MKHMNIPKDSGVWAVGNTLAQDLKDMGLVVAVAAAVSLSVEWFHGLSPAKLLALILGA